jgi:predicted metal-dependent enzyme (double-stranded beta helix superfamily)
MTHDSTPAPRLRTFVRSVEHALVDAGSEADTVARVRAAMRELVRVDDWLQPACAVPHPDHYQQYLLHLDPGGRFSVVSFVWGPGQQTPIHDHTVWGVIGMLRGAERGARFELDDAGRAIAVGSPSLLQAGDVELVSPATGDVHRVSNASADTVAISIHCYGADIGRVRRHVYFQDGRPPKPFVSGYA